MFHSHSNWAITYVQSYMAFILYASYIIFNALLFNHLARIAALYGALLFANDITQLPGPNLLNTGNT